MPYADIIIFAVVIFFLVKGWLNGFFREFFTFLGLVIATLASIWLIAFAAAPLAEAIGISLNLVKALLFIACFILVAFSFGAIGNLMHQRFVEKLGLTHTNRSLGSLFGAAKGALICGIVIMILVKHPIASGLGKKMTKGSAIAGHLVEYTDELIKTLEKAF